MNEAVTLAMRPAPAGQATDRRARDGVKLIRPGGSKVALGLSGAIHEAFTESTLAADR